MGRMYQRVEERFLLPESGTLVGEFRRESGFISHISRQKTSGDTRICCQGKVDY
jgi:hypothetical protein